MKHKDVVDFPISQTVAGLYIIQKKQQKQMRRLENYLCVLVLSIIVLSGVIIYLLLYR